MIGAHTYVEEKRSRGEGRRRERNEREGLEKIFSKMEMTRFAKEEKRENAIDRRPTGERSEISER